MRSHRWMGVGLVAGLLLGLVASATHAPALLWIAQAIRPVGALFLNLLSMVVVPLVATALFTGVAGFGDVRQLSRHGLRAMAFFLGTTVIAIALGFLIGGLIVPLGALTPEHQASLRALAVADTTLVQRAAEAMPSGTRFLVGLVPANPVRAAVEGALLPLVVFVTIFAAAAATLTPEKRAPLMQFAESASAALIRIVHWVLLVAPIGIFALVLPAVAQFGWELVKAMFWFLVAVGVGCFAFILAVYLPAVVLLARLPADRFFRASLSSMLMGFSTTSSLATLPTMLDAADRNLKLPRGISGFVLPLGASLNRGGSALYQTVALLFIAQLMGPPLGAGAMFQAGVAVFLASLTVAAVPTGSVISLFPAFTATGLPVSGLTILIGLDRIPDMFRTMTNVAGHLAGATVVAAAEEKRMG